MKFLKFFLLTGAILVAVLIGEKVYSNFHGNYLPFDLRTRPTPTSVPEEKMSLKVYFGNQKLNSKSDCSLVYAVNRQIPKTSAVAKAALEQLFAGPTEEERAQGYTSFFSEKTSKLLKEIKIVDGIAYVDLNDPRPLIPNASTSCGSAEFLAEIKNTLAQFPTIKEVVLAINGQPQVFYEWLQLDCPPASHYCDPTPFK